MRGVCERWRGPDGFTNFLADVGERPSRAHSLDRVDNSKGYEPGNCRWATFGQQARNRGVSRLTDEKALRVIDLWEAGHRLPDIARELGIGKATVGGVIKGTCAADITGRDISDERLRSAPRPEHVPPDGWREAARERIIGSGLMIKDVAAQSGCSPGLLVNLLAGRMRCSSHFPAIYAVVDSLASPESTTTAAPHPLTGDA
jgi:hypothetical protein